MKNLKFLIWDFDGTLVHRPSTWSASILEAFKSIIPSHSVSLEDISRNRFKIFPWHEPAKNYRHLRNPDVWWKTHLDMMAKVAIDLGAEPKDAQEIALLAEKRFLTPLHTRFIQT